jgi:SanA protein
MRKWRPEVRRRRVAAAVAIAGLLAWGASALGIRAASAGRVFSASSIAELPPARAAVVPGCAERLPGGAHNLYFLRRIAAAADLYRAGKAGCFIVSGDNHVKEYDEASAMKSALAAAGVPGERIVCDYAGFRTLDTVVRAKEVFGLDSFIVVSQPAHVRRAVFTARGFGCDAWGYEAGDVHGPDSWRTSVREQFAKVAAAWDVLVRRRPKFLGPREALPPVLPAE